ncbi:class I SAM-dependent methyltransferase [Amycolatopsis sp. YIM 10]|uniref:class I SAM-dependent methyltransferase n=1 Tax=Amycolatopsis sp. YIM 10 TaxID=2653857 RepID=UPI001290151B|nr:class I SAM-dependent methyltransferase [Amycolatopsis sp. YIM 10]QFU89739.1 Ubiquinone biosynthesis O-methyltransferase [Amycolatopsis sp. YIM 10]
MPSDSQCRVCGGTVREFFDFGRQPLSDAFLAPESDPGQEFFYRLATGACQDCTMVQLMAEVPRERMFHDAYPYYSSGSAYMRTHFEELAKRLLATELTGDDPFVVEIGCNDGIMLRALAEAGVRHLGVEPSGAVADVAAARGIRVRKAFFEDSTARQILAESGPADVIYAANTLCHIPYIASILTGVKTLLAPSGAFVFEDPYLGEIIERTSFDQIYDEHFFLFSARSVQAMAARYGLELVDVERLPVHGGEVRYTLVHAGARTPSGAVRKLLADELTMKLAEPETLHAFGTGVLKIKDELTSLLRELRAEGKRVVGYGATAKSATVTNLCGIGPDLVPFICDSTPAKQGRVSPGRHIPVRPPEAFADPYPDYSLLFAWNHAEEIMAKEQAFQESGGKWILYVPEVRIV